jgi:hypothetical protein
MRISLKKSLVMVNSVDMAQGLLLLQVLQHTQVRVGADDKDEPIEW